MFYILFPTHQVLTVSSSPNGCDVRRVMVPVTLASCARIIQYTRRKTAAATWKPAKPTAKRSGGKAKRRQSERR